MAEPESDGISDISTTSCSGGVLDLQQIQDILDAKCDGLGLSCHPFLVGWYNYRVTQPRFHLPYNHDTLGMLVVSSPTMFERVFLPYLCSSSYTVGQLDPLDQCLKHFFSKLISSFIPGDVEAIHDFELHSVSRRPRVLVQTVGHVAGVARYYQKCDVNPDPWPNDTRLYGVSMHPHFGGWFAFRGVLLFKKVQMSDLHQSEPKDCVPDQAMRRQLLERYNFNWNDWSFRDLIMGGVKERYSEEQRLYFSTNPRRRETVIKELQCKQAI